LDDAESKDGLRQIIFEVMGYPESHRKHALQRVREEVESLHKRWFRSIKADEMVPCCCSECCNSTNPRLYKLEDLLKLREKRNETLCYSSGEDIAIFHLLEGVYEESEIKNMGARGGFREY
jgi:internalin A